MNETRYPTAGYVTYNEAFAFLTKSGFSPVPGSSRFTNEAGAIGRIKEGPGWGDTFFVETTKS